MNCILTRIALAGSGAMLGLIGGALIIAPQDFLELSDVTVERDPGLMSELAAPSGMLLAAASIMLLGSVRLRYAGAGLATGVLVYGSYGLVRLLSMVLHGLPSQSLIVASLVEIAIAVMLGMLRVTGRAARHVILESYSCEGVV